MQLNLPEIHGFKVEMGVGPNPKGNGKALNVWLVPGTVSNIEKMKRAGQSRHPRPAAHRPQDRQVDRGRSAGRAGRAHRRRRPTRAGCNRKAGQRGMSVTPVPARTDRLLRFASSFRQTQPVTSPREWLGRLESACASSRTKSPCTRTTSSATIRSSSPPTSSGASSATSSERSRTTGSNWSRWHLSSA
jgi:hypothetical protein